MLNEIPQLIANQIDAALRASILVKGLKDEPGIYKQISKLVDPVNNVETYVMNYPTNPKKLLTVTTISNDRITGEPFMNPVFVINLND